jgi:hypothetical protein
MSAADQEFALAREWVVTLWVPLHADSAAVLDLVDETGTALATAMGDLSRKAAKSDGLPSRLTVEP